MKIYYNKRKRLHKKRDPPDWFGAPTWPPFYFFWKTNVVDVKSCEKGLRKLSQFTVRPTLGTRGFSRVRREF